MPVRPGPFTFGRTSSRELETLEPDLRRVLERAIEGRRSMDVRTR